DLVSVVAGRDDDAAVAGDLATRDEETACGVVLLQEPDVSRHAGVDVGQRDLVGQLDHEHGRRSVSSGKSAKMLSGFGLSDFGNSDLEDSMRSLVRSASL